MGTKEIKIKIQTSGSSVIGTITVQACLCNHSTRSRALFNIRILGFNFGLS